MPRPDTVPTDIPASIWKTRYDELVETASFTAWEREQAKRSALAIWNSCSHLLTQDQIDSIESHHAADFANLQPR